MLIEGMGSFWQKISSEMIDSLYQSLHIDKDTLIDCTHANETCAMDQNITTWLHRFIRSCSPEDLLLFLRFTTGSACFIPHMYIKLDFVNQPQSHMHPLAKTCFKILLLPRQYSSFSELQTNLNFFLRKCDQWQVHDEDFILDD